MNLPMPGAIASARKDDVMTSRTSLEYGDTFIMFFPEARCVANSVVANSVWYG